MKKIEKLYEIVATFIKKLGKDDISAYSAEAAFFLIISSFPFVMLLITLLNYLPITENVLAALAEKILPSAVSGQAQEVISELAERASKTIISITALVTLWTASKGMFSVIKGLNVACGVNETRGYIRLRLSSLLYTLIFAGGVLFSLILLVFGNHIFMWLSNKISFLGQYSFLIGMRQIIGFSVLIVFFWLIYAFAPNRKTKFLSELPGAVFASLGWIVFSYAFSFYINYIGNLSYFYGSLTSAIVLMLWLYICMYIVFIGAEINVFLKSKLFKRIRK